MGVKVLCVCGHGLGTALILKMSVEGALLELGFKNPLVEPRAFSVAAEEDADLYAITVEMVPHFKSKGIENFIVIKDVTDKNEVKKAIAPFLDKLKKKT